MLILGQLLLAHALLSLGLIGLVAALLPAKKIRKV
jgi:hypothetical protein